MSAQAAVLLDRDGVIVAEVGYLSAPEQLKILPGADHAIALLNRMSMPVAVVTNQSGVARGYFDESRVEEIHAELRRRLVARGARIDAFFFCPHHPTAGQGPHRRRCACRKPRPGLLRQAAAELGIELSDSFMVGDKLSDLQAGAAAGCQTILVQTGYGAQVTEPLDRAALRLLGKANDLRAAVKLIIASIADGPGN